MDNHIHLLIGTTFVDISKIMYNINKDYAVYFNQKYHFVGHLFQGRFRWELVDNDPYYATESPTSFSRAWTAMQNIIG